MPKLPWKRFVQHDFYLLLGLAACSLLAAGSLLAACSPVAPGPAPTPTGSFTPPVLPETGPVSTVTPAAAVPTEMVLTPTAVEPTASPPTSTPTVSPQFPAAPIMPGLIRPVKAQVEAARVVVESWSPDGAWLAFRMFASPDPQQAGGLHFLSSSTGQTCPYPGNAAPGPAGQTVIWGEGGLVIVREEGGYLAGQPCQEFHGVTFEMPVVGFSPTGIYAAETQVTGSADGVIQARTVIRSVGTGAELTGIDWSVEQRLGDLGLGGEWLTADRFLLFETRERGPVLLQIGGELVSAASELFGVNHQPGTGVTLAARGAMVPGTTDYHLILFGVGVEADFPPVRLYHSEDGSVNELPFRHTWSPAFSPDGRWLLLRGAQEDVYLHPVDPASVEAARSKPVMIVDDASGPMVWSPAADRLAYNTGDLVQMLDVAVGQVTSRWQADGYQLHPNAWSPDGTRLAALGTRPDGGQEALFIIPVVQP